MMQTFSTDNVATISGLGLFGVGGTATRTSAGRGAARATGNLVERTAAKQGTTVLGKFPEYLDVASELGANRFQIPARIWNSMSAAEQWAANMRFLDRAIARGDAIVLSNRVSDITKVTGAFRQELEYLISNGYRLSRDGTRMIK